MRFTQCEVFALWSVDVVLKHGHIKNKSTRIDKLNCFTFSCQEEESEEDVDVDETSTTNTKTESAPKQEVKVTSEQDAKKEDQEKEKLDEDEDNSSLASLVRREKKKVTSWRNMT